MANQPTAEQLVPTRWITRGVDRPILAAHLQALRKRYGNRIARAALRHCYWVGIVSSNRARWIGHNPN